MTRALLESIFRQTLSEVDPFRTTSAAVTELKLDESQPLSAIAIGKGSHAMLRGAVDGLRARGLVLSQAIVIAPDEGGPHDGEVLSLVGDHPIPGERSQAAADQLTGWLQELPETHRVLVLLSGGTTSLCAAPIDGIPQPDLVRLFEQLLASGADILTMNAIRKRVLRFGAGRLAVALAPRKVDLLLASDVLGDDPAYIGSGLCTGDSLTASKVRRMLERNGAFESLPASIVTYLDDVHHQRKPETPKPGSSLFRAVHTRVVLSNKNALQAAARAAEERRLHPVRVIERPLVGEARSVGSELAMRLIAWRQQLATAGESPDIFACTVAGGESTVTLGTAAPSHGQGGRCQELALAAARELNRFRPRSETVSILVAGTDGRDGPTDAAGAVVDAQTWGKIVAAGIDPEHALATHNSYEALNAADALIRTGLTGTNVNDIIVAVVRPAVAEPVPERDDLVAAA
jgi:hydroxypyruvate reductase